MVFLLLLLIKEELGDFSSRHVAMLLPVETSVFSVISSASSEKQAMKKFFYIL